MHVLMQIINRESILQHTLKMFAIFFGESHIVGRIPTGWWQEPPYVVEQIESTT